MRRLAAILLLSVFGALLPSATALTLAASEQLLPACCRTHGAHHCMMSVHDGQAEASSPQWRSPGCPYRQALHAVTTIPLVNGPGPARETAFASAPLRVQSGPMAAAVPALGGADSRGPPLSCSAFILNV